MKMAAQPAIPITSRNWRTKRGRSGRRTEPDYGGNGRTIAGVRLAAPGASPVPSTVTADTISLLLSGDAYKGSPQFVLLMDGKQIAGPTSVTASHSAGQDQSFTFSNHFGVGDHTLGIDFVNDLSAGTKTTDRNLYIEQVSYNGASVLSQPTTLYSDGV